MNNKIETQQFSNYEAEVISLISSGKQKLQTIKEHISFSEDILESVLKKLEDKNIIIFDEIKLQYGFDIPLDNEKIVLTGNVMLPMTIIKKKDCVLVNRGTWYKLPVDFDFRRIVWNVELPNNKRSTLIDLIRDSVLKEKKYKIQQSEEYKNLQGKLVPYNSNIKLRLNVVGDEICDISIIFLCPLSNNQSGIAVDFRDFTVKSSIRTIDLINELNKDSSERNFENIEINNVFGIDDFIFTGNCIPIKMKENNGRTILEYIKIEYKKGSLILNNYTIDNTGTQRKTGADEFTDIVDGISVLKDMFQGSVADKLLVQNSILVETEK